MRNLIPLLLVLAVIPIAGREALAQKILLGSIQFKGAPEYSDAELLAAAGLKKGMILTTDELNDHGKQLMANGVFDNLAFKFDGAALIFSLTPTALLYPVRIDNLPLNPGAELDARLHDQIPLYHGKVPGEGKLLDDVRQALEKMLAAEGLDATVAAVPYSENKQRDKVTAMSFTITAPAVRLGAVQIQGASEASTPGLHRLAVLAGADPFESESSIEKLKRNVVWFYENQGYAAAKVQAVQSGKPEVTAEAIRVPYALTIEEGKVYKIGSFRLPQGAIVTQEDVDKILAQSGAGVMPPKLRPIRVLIDNRYKAKGYLDVVLTLHPQFDEDAAIVNYTADIDPGAVYHLAFVKFDGVSDETRIELMRNWQLMPGEPFDQSYLSAFMMKVQFQDPALKRSLAAMLTKYEITADPSTHEVNVVIHLEK